MIAVLFFSWKGLRRVNLQVENVEVLEDNHIKFDFLGKDSIRYENEVAVHPKVHSLVRQFCKTTKDNKSALLPPLIALAPLRWKLADVFDVVGCTPLPQEHCQLGLFCGIM